MSCPTYAVFENIADGTQKRVHINLGWFAPSDYQLARIMVEAEKAIDLSYEWNRMYLPVIKEAGFIRRKKFYEMKLFFDYIDLCIDPSLKEKAKNQFTLKNTWKPE